MAKAGLNEEIDWLNCPKTINMIEMIKDDICTINRMYLPVLREGVKKTRVATDTDLAGYPANNFAGYRISGQK